MKLKNVLTPASSMITAARTLKVVFRRAFVLRSYFLLSSEWSYPDWSLENRKDEKSNPRHGCTHESLFVMTYRLSHSIRETSIFRLHAVGTNVGLSKMARAVSASITTREGPDSPSRSMYQIVRPDSGVIQPVSCRQVVFEKLARREIDRRLEIDAGLRVGAVDEVVLGVEGHVAADGAGFGSERVGRSH